MTTKNQDPLRGMLLMMAAVAMLAVMDSISKYLTLFYPVIMVVWSRYLFHTLFVLLVLGPRLRWRFVRTTRLALQGLRGLCLVGSSLFFVSATKFLPLADATAISFLTPILVTLMAVVLLKEKVDFARWIAVFCGFVGVLIIIHPGAGVFAWASLLPLGTVVCLSSYQVLSRRLAQLESPFTSIFYAGLVGLVLLTPLISCVWQMPQSWPHALALVSIGVIGGASHLLMMIAYGYAPASRLAPFSYTQLIWVSLISYFFFGGFPELKSLLGIAILLGCGLFTALQEPWQKRADD